MKFLASAADVKAFQRAVGILLRSMKLFDQSLLDSICAAAFVGPKQWIPSVAK